MNMKFKSLKTRILSLTFIIILFTVMIAGFSVFYQYKTENLKNIVFDIRNIEKNIILLKNNEQDFIINFSRKSKLLISDDTPFEKKFRSLNAILASIIDSFSEKKIIRNDSKAENQINILSKNLKIYP